MLSKKKIIIIIIAVALAASITVATLIIFKPSNEPAPVVITKESADSIKTQAVQALDNNDVSKAKTLFQEAKQQYEEVGDTEGLSNSDYQLYLIEHPTPIVTQ